VDTVRTESQGKFFLGTTLEVLTVTTMKINVYRDVAPCGLARRYRRFEGPCCFYINSRRFFILWRWRKFRPKRR